jgi:hypothetical protein
MAQAATLQALRSLNQRQLFEAARGNCWTGQLDHYYAAKTEPRWLRSQ